MQHLRRFFTFVLFSVWFGGLTFYAAVVVPIGGSQLGETTQGFVTQQVTIRLNALAAIALVVWAWEIAASRRWRRTSIVIWGLQAVLLLGLAVLHVKLSSMLDLVDRSGPNVVDFYSWHRLYLIGTTLQWLLGLAMVWEWVAAPSRAITNAALDGP